MIGTAYAARRTYLRPKTEDGAHLRPPEGLLTVLHEILLYIIDPYSLDLNPHMYFISYSA